MKSIMPSPENTKILLFAHIFNGGGEEEEIGGEEEEAGGEEDEE